MTLKKQLDTLSQLATPGTWHEMPNIKRVSYQGVEGPRMSYLTGGPHSVEGTVVSLGSERTYDHLFVPLLVNAYRAGKLEVKE